ncbi:site-specific recombinase [Mesocricetibacter intestinalis]|uniref:site-specific recombinase n=1 Tax=Mesocricetibacter intestinalis TaxID=1521930 RepID=UPI0010614BD3|nr:recombinase [Mesocricetibacter intestinalis]
MSKINKIKLRPFLLQQAENGNIFDLLNELCKWLRQSKSDDLSQKINSLINELQLDEELAKNLTAQLCRWLCGLRLYPLFISNGIFGREGFGREIRQRLYEKFNPEFKDTNDLRDVFFLLFRERGDRRWLENTPLKLWVKLLDLLRSYATEEDKQRVYRHLQEEGLLAVKMLSIWLAAEDLEPELIRLEPTILNADSPFVALNQEIMKLIEAQHKGKEFDDAHLQVMYQQSCEQVERLQKRGAIAGSSLHVAHLLERLKQTLTRLELLLQIFTLPRLPSNEILLLTGKLAVASAEQHSITDLWKNSLGMVSRTITQHTSDHGEHYITRDKKEYFGMFFSAAGAGIIIACMALLKIYLGSIISDKVWMGIASGLNYGIGFVIIFMLHFTVATKQPAMTAARFAEAVGRKQGRSVNMQLAQLLVDVVRSQSIAVLGNVIVAASLSGAIAYGYARYTGTALLSEADIEYQLHSIDPTQGTLWFAAIAGLWLFCSGIISGFFDNRSNYLNLRMRLHYHPCLKRVASSKFRAWFSNYVHKNYGSIMGNLCFGMLLGLTAVFGYLIDLPLDIRHVAFSSANLGYATVSGNLSTEVFFLNMGYVLLIGAVNLIVSFSLTLWIALRSLGTEVDSWCNIIKCICQIIRQRPLSLFLPFQLENKN